MVTLDSHEKCTGCGASYHACPQQAIYYYDDEEGFPTPQIDKDKCIECGICNNICPSVHMPKTQNTIQAYAAQMIDKDVLKDSTSGGLFTVFSREVFRRGGVVYGCVWDEDYNAVIRKAECENDIVSMRGSKYVWSYMGDKYQEIKQYLESGKMVLFIGLPCQVAGLKNYIRKDYENLILMDFFCGGTPSPLAFREYLKTITKKTPVEKLDLKFRDKEKDGVGVHISFNSGKVRKYQSHITNSYYYAFYTKVINRYPCYECNYRYEDRIADITIGDYWEIEKYHSEFDIKAGVSAMLLNSEKGKLLLEAVKPELRLVETKKEYIAGYNNLTLGTNRKVFYPPAFREDFFELLKKKGWKSAERKYLFGKKRLKLLIKHKIPKKCVLFIKRIRQRRK